MLALASSLLPYATDDVLVELLPLRAEMVSTASELVWLRAERAGVDWCRASWYGERAGVDACQASWCCCVPSELVWLLAKASWCCSVPSELVMLYTECNITPPTGRKLLI